MFEKIKLWWKSSTTTEKINAIFRGITATAAIGGAIYCGHEVHKSHDIVNFAVSKIGEGVDVTVSDELVEAAVEASARQQIGRSVKAATDRTWRDIQEMTKNQVEKAVKEKYGEITDEIGKRMAVECEKINKTEILDDIKDKAKETLTEKLEENLDSITEEYSNNLTNMGKIYEALAEKMNQKA